MTSREYENSHPWLSFSADLKPLSAAFWMLLGETRSKIDHIAASPLKPEVAAEMHELYLAKGYQATTAIEGNTLTEAQVRLLMESRLPLRDSQRYLEQEVRNIIGACGRILDGIRSSANRLVTPEGILEFNRLVLEELAVEEGVVPGEFRRHSVGVWRYLGAPAVDCEYLVDRLCKWLNGPEFAPATVEMQVPYAVIKAVLAHLYLAWIHPFGDGNGRTARLVELQILLAAGVPTPAAHLLSNHYNQTRTEYYRQLDLASKSGGDVLGFLNYAVVGFVDGLRGQLGRIRNQQFEDRWEQFVYEEFGDVRSEARRRQRKLVLALSKQATPIPGPEIPDLSTELARAYGGANPRTLARDLNAILKTSLVERGPSGYRARKEQILAFLPFSAE